MTTRDEILSAAVHEIRTRDEASFRVTVVAKQAGCATSVLYHYFGSREGLIDAALVQLANQEAGIIRSLSALTEEFAESYQDFESFLVVYTKTAHSPERRASRAVRARLLGAAQTRPALREEAREFGEQTNEINESILSRLSGRGLIRPDVDIRALSLCLRALDFGHALDDLNEEPRVDLDAWIHLMRVLASALAPPKS